jgi:hypothetical protein
MAAMPRLSFISQHLPEKSGLIPGCLVPRLSMSRMELDASQSHSKFLLLLWNVWNAPRRIE